MKQILLVALVSAWACSGDDAPPPWTLEYENDDAAVLSIWGTAADDIWAVGGDQRDGNGPLVLHFDGQTWSPIATGLSEGDLWWVFGFDDGPVYMGGSGGAILRYQDDAFSAVTTPSVQTVFGIWASSPDDLWAVGADSNGFAWRGDGDALTAVPDLDDVHLASNPLWKVFGRSANEVWIVGDEGKALVWDGSGFEETPTGVGSVLFTIHGTSDRLAAVGGYGTGVLIEYEGSTWVDVTPPGVPGLTGIHLRGPEGLAVGEFGTVALRGPQGWDAEAISVALDVNLHAAWIDPDGGLWAVGGQTLTLPLTSGKIVRRR